MFRSILWPACRRLTPHRAVAARWDHHRRPYSTAAASTAASQVPPMDDGGWYTLVGLEVHAQIRSATKAFSRSRVEFAAQPNTNVSFWDMALPGTLPTLNKRCVEAGIMTAIALNASVQNVSYFDRKHYFYYDLPSGYQITQNDRPFALDGHVAVGFGDEEKQVGLERLQIEHDSAKSVHTMPECTLVDLNRAGIGLVEIVTKPDMENGAEAAAFVRELIAILDCIGTCDCNLAEGSLRVDANVSVHHPDVAHSGVRTEVKNINGLRFLAKAVDFEAARHRGVLAGGGKLTMETRTFDVPTGTTVPMRTKEGGADYRFMPEPDLPPLRISSEHVEHLRQQLPELPRETVRRLSETYSLSIDSCRTLQAEPGGVAYFQACIAAEPTVAPQAVLRWILSEAFAVLRAENMTLDASAGTSTATALPVTPDHLAELVKMLEEGTITRKVAKRLFSILADGGSQGKPVGPAAILETLEGGKVIGDEADIEGMCRAAIAKHPGKVKQYQGGQHGLLGLFMGEVVRSSQGQVDPKTAVKVLKRVLAEDP